MLRNEQMSDTQLESLCDSIENLEWARANGYPRHNVCMYIARNGSLELLRCCNRFPQVTGN